MTPSEQSDSPGTWAAISAALDGYHAINLIEALKLVPDTGDWHGSLRISAGMTLERERAAGREFVPNQTAEEMRAWHK